MGSGAKTKHQPYKVVPTEEPGVPTVTPADSLSWPTDIGDPLDWQMAGFNLEAACLASAAGIKNVDEALVWVSAENRSSLRRWMETSRIWPSEREGMAGHDLRSACRK